MRGKGGRKDRGQGRDRAIDQAGEAGLYHLQEEEALGCSLFLLAGIDRAGRLQISRNVDVLMLLFSQIGEQRAHADIRRAFSRLRVKLAGLIFHELSLLADRIEAQVLEEPDWIALQEPLHVLPGDIG